MWNFMIQVEPVSILSYDSNTDTFTHSTYELDSVTLIWAFDQKDTTTPRTNRMK